MKTNYVRTKIKKNLKNIWGIKREEEHTLLRQSYDGRIRRERKKNSMLGKKPTKTKSQKETPHPKPHKASNVPKATPKNQTSCWEAWPFVLSLSSASIIMILRITSPHHTYTEDPWSFVLTKQPESHLGKTKNGFFFFF